MRRRRTKSAQPTVRTQREGSRPGRVDPFSPERRSEIMRSVRRTGTDIEVRFRKALWRDGVRYRVNRPTEGTRPDIAIVNSRVAIFVDGCFWHGCPRHWKLPRTNAEFWQRRRDKNVSRDRRDDARLRAAGWTVLRFWECDLRRDPRRAASAVRAALRRSGVRRSAALHRQLTSRRHL